MRATVACACVGLSACGSPAGPPRPPVPDGCVGPRCVAPPAQAPGPPIACTYCALATVSFAPAVAYPSLYKPYVVLAADLDGDGDLDLVVLDEESSTASVFVNDGHGAFAAAPAPDRYGFPTGEYPTGGALADLDGDGVLDLVTADYHGNSVSVLRGTLAGGAYTLAAAVSYPTAAGAETSNLAIGDLDGDGALDVIATNPQTSSISVLRGLGDGRLAAARNVAIAIPGAPEPVAPYAIALGDFDGDGHLDAAIADETNDRVAIELGNGDGTLRAGVAPAIGGLGPFNLIARDLDGDGRLDLAISERGGDAVSVLLGRGDGTFAPARSASTGAGSGPYDVAAADFNRDGVPDLITADYLTGSASVLLGLGGGRFAAPIDAGPTGAYCYSVATGDLDGDGRPDFAAANAAGNSLTISLSTSH